MTSHPEQEDFILNTKLYYPAPEGLPIAIHPPRGSREMWNALEHCDWNSQSKAGQGELLRAGALWLHGFLDESHAVAQGIHSAEGSYWHALMHRSEGDYSNSKYWYRKVGKHPIFPDLLVAARRLEATSKSTGANWFKLAEWDPFQFVDALEEAGRHAPETLGLLQAVTREEYNLLMGFCLERI
jgi:hypothetical protein